MLFKQINNKSPLTIQVLQKKITLRRPCKGRGLAARRLAYQVNYKGTTFLGVLGAGWLQIRAAPLRTNPCPVGVPGLPVLRVGLRVVQHGLNVNVLNGYTGGDLRRRWARSGADAEESKRGGITGRTGRGGGRSATVGISTATDEDRGN
jgi:hypothetical protein